MANGAGCHGAELNIAAELRRLRSRVPARGNENIRQRGQATAGMLYIDRIEVVEGEVEVEEGEVQPSSPRLLLSPVRNTPSSV